ncbi:MAG: hypothetical protein JNJ64_10670 [Flavobacteriales bacterium]|nr:hypothetical protein [Flavobacteriales bacterium]
MAPCLDPAPKAWAPAGPELVKPPLLFLGDHPSTSGLRSGKLLTGIRLLMPGITSGMVRVGCGMA